MRIMALDVGEKTIGVAISDALLLTAQARPTIRRKGSSSDIEVLRRLAEENEVHQILVGQPLHMNGKDSRQSQSIGLFAAELKNKLDIAVIIRDDRRQS